MCRNRQNGYCFGHVAEFSSATTHHNSDFAVPDHADPKSFANLGQLLQTDMVVLEDFINEEEETQLLQEIEPYMARLRYEYSHWDDVSEHLFRFVLHFTACFRLHFLSLSNCGRLIHLRMSWLIMSNNSIYLALQVFLHCILMISIPIK